MSWRRSEQPRPRNVPHEVSHEKREETRRTVREWNERMERINSIDMGNSEPEVSTRGAGYSGLYQYLSSNVRVGSGGEMRGRQVEPTNFERWASKQQVDLRTKRSARVSVEQKQILDVSPQECREIRHCFERADTTRDGYLDCEELKTFMECRNAPITHREAKELLDVVDSEYQAYINLDQIMFLVFHCGIATAKEKPICLNQFKKVLRRLASGQVRSGTGTPRSSHRREFEQRRAQTAQSYVQHERRRAQTAQSYAEPPPVLSTYSRQYEEQEIYQDPSTWDKSRRRVRPTKSAIVEEPIYMDGAKSYFEEIASEALAEVEEGVLYRKYRHEVRSGLHSLDAPEAEEPRKALGPPPQWATMVLPSQRPSTHLPSRTYDEVKQVWVEKLAVEDKDGESLKERLDKINLTKTRQATISQPVSSLAKQVSDPLSSPSKPLAPGLSHMAQKIDVSHTMPKLDKTALARIFDKQNACPSTGVAIMPDMPPQVRLKSTGLLKNGGDESGFRVITMAKPEPSLAKIPAKTSTTVHVSPSSPAPTVRMAKSKAKTKAKSISKMDDFKTDVLFKNASPTLCQPSHQEFN